MTHLTSPSALAIFAAKITNQIDLGHHDDQHKAWQDAAQEMEYAYQQINDLDQELPDNGWFVYADAAERYHHWDSLGR